MINTILTGDSKEKLTLLANNSIDCVVTSPPYYGLRDYDTEGQIGHEQTPGDYIKNLVIVFREVYRVLKNEGTLWINIGDSYAGSGKGGSPTDREYKQRTNASSSIGNIYDKDSEAIEHSKRINVTRKTFEGIKQKELIGIPWALAFALRADGWFLRQDIIWSKPSPMPEAVKDRFCKSHEYIFLFSKKNKYYFNFQYALEPATGYDNRKTETVNRKKYDQEVWGVSGARERWSQRGYVGKEGSTGLAEQHHGVNIPTRPLRTKRDVWTIASEPSVINHFAMFPEKLILPCILCGCPEGGVVLDPFFGAGTTGIVAKKNNRKYIGCEINPAYVEIARRRIADVDPLFNTEVEENECFS